MNRHLVRSSARLALLSLSFGLAPLACMNPGTSANSAESAVAAAGGAASSGHAVASTSASVSTLEPMAELDAWTAASQMSPGFNIGNTLENTTQWETGWGNPVITRAYVEKLAALGFKTVRIPVAWDTYAQGDVIDPAKLARVDEVVRYVTDLGMFAVVNIHWDGGWIDSSDEKRFGPEQRARFTPEAERKYRAYWKQIAEHFADRNEKVIFEALNEETNFAGEGATEQAFATLTRVQQLFVDVVRASGGNNVRRLILVAGYHTDFQKTASEHYRLPKDPTPRRMFISVHYYTPWTFCGLTKDESWGKARPTWGTPDDYAELNRLFDLMQGFTQKHDLPAFIGEFGASHEKEMESRGRFMAAVAKASVDRRMVPVLWDTGHDLSRTAPFDPSPALEEMLRSVSARPSTAPGPVTGNASPEGS